MGIRHHLQGQERTNTEGVSSKTAHFGLALDAEFYLLRTPLVAPPHTVPGNPRPCKNPLSAYTQPHPAVAGSWDSVRYIGTANEGPEETHGVMVTTRGMCEKDVWCEASSPR